MFVYFTSVSCRIMPLAHIICCYKLRLTRQHGHNTSFMRVLSVIEWYLLLLRYYNYFVIIKSELKWMVNQVQRKKRLTGKNSFSSWWSSLNVCASYAMRAWRFPRRVTLKDILKACMAVSIQTTPLCILKTFFRWFLKNMCYWITFLCWFQKWLPFLSITSGFYIK
jgi:hypothetical protein